MTRNNFLPYALPFIGDEEVDAVIDTLKSNWLSKGPKTVEFEKQFAAYVGARHAIAMNSCTAALHIALLAMGVGEGDEVITTPLTFAATANTIIHTGARPVFVDVDPATGCLDPARIESRISPRTKAIVPVHFAGDACKMDEIMDIARKHDLRISEDAAHAIYTTHRGRMIGSIGDTTSFSFYATKNICTGEGGMLTTNDDEIAEKARIMSLHGMSKNAWNRYGKEGNWYYEILHPGYKYNMTDIQAAMGLCQLKKLPEMQSIREDYARIYNEEFAGLEEIITPAPNPENRHSWHLYVIRIKEDRLKISRNRFIEELAKENIGTSVHFIPLHLQPYYRDRYQYAAGDFPVAEQLYNGMISLPLYPKMTLDDVYDVVHAVKKIVGANRKAGITSPGDTDKIPVS